MQPYRQSSHHIQPGQQPGQGGHGVAVARADAHHLLHDALLLGLVPVFIMFLFYLLIMMYT